MASQIVAQAETVEHAVEPLESDVESLSEAETHAVTEVHGEEHVTGVFPPFDPNTFASQLLWLAITFGALYLLMSKLALPRLGSILEDRKARIDADLAAAEASRQKTDAAIASYEAALAAARQNAHNLAEQTKASIKADLDGKRKAVETDLSQKMAAAEARIQATKAEALGHVGEIAAETAQILVATLFQPVGEQEARDAVAQVAKE